MVRAPHAADPIFEQLAGAILRGELAPEAPLPPERVLSEEFGVSRIVLRQAVHRLADIGLVRVRQGGATVVVDPRRANDLRLIALYYRLAPHGDLAKSIRRDVIEKQFLQGLSLVDVFSRRASRESKDRLVVTTERFALETATEESFAAFVEAFWREIARSGRNRIFEMEVAWWYDALARAQPESEPTTTLAQRVTFYCELARRMLSGEHATHYYLAVIGPQLEALFAPDSDS